ncbi:hypothetical protein VOLCADRAFT_86689 [Volvox carteri f. nagariensis]|uniref:Uncharacterized protein n=1 Tax=Volvox carteri f. nagariensis TaxID=3068 RepID=D8TJC2_VOLCA|nr:uncharacterized protein VOLCADRAFT_86689 [Volvox carteri f. nagariensis]EFJ52347.1 hypothetical protein VOLCADRAFT_86689 [Volvox carteri f. nagariensis]|eukprot:XP_002946420.1 hypothetical protein VOLCADRAFT_86689 [Volvox carteri f. nagariensis]
MAAEVVAQLAEDLGAVLTETELLEYIQEALEYGTRQQPSMRQPQPQLPQSQQPPSQQPWAQQQQQQPQRCNSSSEGWGGGCQQSERRFGGSEVAIRLPSQGNLARVYGREAQAAYMTLVSNLVQQSDEQQHELDSVVSELSRVVEENKLLRVQLAVAAAGGGGGAGNGAEGPTFREQYGIAGAPPPRPAGAAAAKRQRTAATAAPGELLQLQLQGAAAEGLAVAPLSQLLPPSPQPLLLLPPPTRPAVLMSSQASLGYNGSSSDKGGNLGGGNNPAGAARPVLLVSGRRGSQALCAGLRVGQAGNPRGAGGAGTMGEVAAAAGDECAAEPSGALHDVGGEVGLGAAASDRSGPGVAGGGVVGGVGVGGVGAGGVVVVVGGGGGTVLFEKGTPGPGTEPLQPQLPSQPGLKKEEEEEGGDGVGVGAGVGATGVPVQRDPSRVGVTIRKGGQSGGRGGFMRRAPVR